MTNYASLQETPDFYGEYATGEYGIPNHHMSEPTRSQWNHIEDLDSFFTRVYKYHQKHGFTCMAVKEFVELHEFIFISGLTFSLMFAVRYDLLFSHEEGHRHQWIFSVLKPFDEVMSTLPLGGWVLLIFLTIAFVLSVIRKFYAMVLYWDIKQFYNQALKIDDTELDNMTWHNVQKKLIQVQLELQMCIHKRELTELDIYHRILRQTNYLVALVNKRLLPPRMEVPMLGEIVYWTKGLRFNLMFLLFWSPWSPFENPWHLREEYKRPGYRERMAKQLSRQVLWLTLVNLVAMPGIFLAQIIFYFFNYFESVRKEPGKFGIRYWSHYGQLYFRHFNELDHELHSRLTRAYKPATKYLSSFCSPLLVILAQHIAFACSSVLAIFICISFLDNEILYWDQVLTMLAALTGIITVCRSMQPDETQIWCPEQLLEAVVLHSHYLPGLWQGNAHTAKVRASFQQLFQYRFAALLEEFMSPILVPFFLLKYIYPRTLDFVDFFRNFTISVVGVGDVCSFAQMDIRKHGHPDWQAERATAEGGDEIVTSTQYDQAEDGKVELSLMHFTATNPNWQPPESAMEFVDKVNLESHGLLAGSGSENNYYRRHSLDPVNGPFGVLSSMDLLPNIDADTSPRAREELPPPQVVPRSSPPSQARGSSQPPQGRASMRSSIFQVPDSIAARISMFNNTRSEGPDQLTTEQNMRASTVILHNRNVLRKSVRFVQSAGETTPLLSNN